MVCLQLGSGRIRTCKCCSPETGCSFYLIKVSLFIILQLRSIILQVFKFFCKIIDILATFPYIFAFDTNFAILFLTHKKRNSSAAPSSYTSNSSFLFFPFLNNPLTRIKKTIIPAYTRNSAIYPHNPTIASANSIFPLLVIAC